MDTRSLLSQTVPSPEPVIRRLHVDLERLARDIPLPANVDLARVADESVRQLWESRVKQFVPVLAARAARERLLEASMPADHLIVSPAEMGESVPADIDRTREA